jgi:hypothetical protein
MPENLYRLRRSVFGSGGTQAHFWVDEITAHSDDPANSLQFEGRSSATQKLIELTNEVKLCSRIKLLSQTFLDAVRRERGLYRVNQPARFCTNHSQNSIKRVIKQQIHQEQALLVSQCRWTRMKTPLYLCLISASFEEELKS